MLKIVRLLLPLCLQLRKSSLIPSCSDSIVFFYTSQWFHWILLFCAGTGLLELKIHNIFMSSVFQTFNWAFLVSFDSIVSIICWANYLLLNMRCCMYMSNSYLSSCFHVCSCIVMILNWSSVISMTGWKSFHYTKERPMLKITRRMRKRGWWENTRYHRLGDILPNCVSVFCETEIIEIHTFLPQGSFLVYPIDLEEDEDIHCQITKGIPPNSPIKVLVRVYIIKVS